MKTVHLLLDAADLILPAVNFVVSVAELFFCQGILLLWLSVFQVTGSSTIKLCPSFFLALAAATLNEILSDQE